MVYEPSATMIDDLKLILGVEDDTQDTVLTLYLRMTGQRVLNEINQAAMPLALESVVIDLAADAFRLNMQASNGSAGEILGSVSNVSDNGQSVSYRDTGYNEVLKSVMSVLKNNEGQLARYRKTGW